MNQSIQMFVAVLAVLAALLAVGLLVHVVLVASTIELAFGPFKATFRMSRTRRRRQSQ
jgi:hypothetical protein